VSTGKIGISRAPGGLPGIDAHVGAWWAMEEAGIRPTHVYGCSAGALVSALQATGMGAGNAMTLCYGLDTEDVIRKRRLWKARVFWLTHFCDRRPIVEQLQELLPVHFKELELPLAVSATRMDTSPPQRVLFDHGPVVRQAVLSSMSIAGVWPYVHIDGVPYTDGGTTDAIVLPDDVEDFDRFYIVNLFRKRSFHERDKNMISRLLWNAEQLSDYEASETRQRLKALPNVTWLDIDIGDASCLEFAHSLVARAAVQAAQQLDAAKAKR